MRKMNRSAQVALGGLLCGLASSMAYAQSLEPVLKPDWTATFKPGVEWAAVQGLADDAVVLVATRDARLHILTIADGHAAVAEPLAVGAGVRLAPGETGDSAAASSRVPSGTKHEDGPRAGLCYCFDRHAAYALRTSAPVGLVWERGRPAAATEAYPDDPESLTGWVAGQATPAGLLLLNRDGRLVLLSRRDGHVRWERDLGASPTAALLGRDSEAVVLQRCRGETSASFIRFDGPEPKVTACRLKADWPTWRALVPEGLLVATPAEVVLWWGSGSPRKLEAGVSELRASLLDVWIPCESRDGAVRGPPPSLVLLVGHGASATAVDVSSGVKRWQLDDRKLPPGVETLTVSGDHVLCSYRSGVAVCDAATGAMRGEVLLREPYELVAAGLVGQRLVALFRDGPRASGMLRLARRELAVSGHDESEKELPATTFYPVPAATVRRVLWSGKRMVLVEPDALRAYVLP